MIASDILKKLLSGEIPMNEFGFWLSDDFEEVTCQDLLNASKTEFIVHFLELVRSHEESVLRPIVKETQTTKNKNILVGIHGHVPFENNTNKQNNQSENTSPWKCGPFPISADCDDKIQKGFYAKTNKNITLFITSTPSKSHKDGMARKFTTHDKDPAKCYDANVIPTTSQIIHPTSPLEDGTKSQKINPTSPLEDGTKSQKIDPTSPLEDGTKSQKINPTSSLEDGTKSRKINPTSPLGDGTKSQKIDLTSPLGYSTKSQRMNVTSPLGDGRKSRRINPTSPLEDAATSQRINQTHPRSKNRPSLIFGDFIPTVKPSKAQKNKKRLSNSFESGSASSMPVVSDTSEISSLNCNDAPINTNSFDTSDTPNPLKNKLLDAIGHDTLGETLSPIQAPEKSIAVDDWIAPDINKVTSKDLLNKLVYIYNSLTLNNLVPSITSDLYSFVLVLLSKQKGEQLVKITAKLKESNSYEDILKIIHNSAYFASRILLNNRHYLNFILDKDASNMLSEYEVIGDFSPDLENFLSSLLTYNLFADLSENSSDMKDNTHGIVCWNNETDNLANFPSPMSFQAFKKQRDMFYEIYRWYPGTSEQSTSVRGTSFHSRIRSLLATAVSPANHAHLARLFVAHMTSECMSKSSQDQLKMKKLQRRFTVASGEDNNHMLPRFESREIFYKEFLTLAENDSFRGHVKDTLISEIYILDDSFVINSDEDGDIEVMIKFVKVTKTLRLLSKFLSYLSMLPYSQVPVDFAVKTGAAADYSVKQIQYTKPKEKILEQELAARHRVKPSIDLIGSLMKALIEGSLAITLPWIVHYLSITDYIGLRTNYSQYLIEELRKVFIKIFTPDSEKNNEVQYYLISMLSWLFDLPHFPQSDFYSDLGPFTDITPTNNLESIDNMLLIHPAKVIELCPFFKRFRTLCASLPGQGAQSASLDGTVKHVKPITLATDPEDMRRIKSDELQINLEQELLKSQPMATQRVIEMVVERVTYCAIHDFREALTAFIESSKIAAINLVNSERNEEDLLAELKAMYATQLAEVNTKCTDIMERSYKERTLPALEALILTSSGVRDHLITVAFRTIKSRLLKWLGEHLNSTDVLCMDIEGFMKKILRVCPTATMPREEDSKSISSSWVSIDLNPDTFDTINISPSTVIFQLKTAIYNLTSSEDISEVNNILKLASSACRHLNVMMFPQARMTIFQLTLELSIMYLTYQPEDVNVELLDKIAEVWDICCPQRKQMAASQEENDEKTSTAATASNISFRHHKFSVPIVSNEGEMLYSFTRILCVRNIRIMNDAAPNNRRTWEKMAEFLVFLMREDYLNECQLTDICTEILQTEWFQSCYDNISRCFRLVMQLWEKPMSQQFTLYMEFFEDIAKSIDRLE